MENPIYDPEFDYHPENFWPNWKDREPIDIDEIPYYLEQE